MKVIIKADEPLLESNEWASNGFNLEKDIDEDAIEFVIYDDREQKIADFTVCLELFNAVASLEKMTLYDKTIDPLTLLEFFLDYMYNTESSYFKILGMHCYRAGSDISEFTLRCAGFFSKVEHGNVYFHLNPNFEEVLNSGIQNEGLKKSFIEKYTKYKNWQLKDRTRLQENLEKEKIYLQELNSEGKNEVLLQAKRQYIEMAETILDVLENKDLCR